MAITYAFFGKVTPSVRKEVKRVLKGFEKVSKVKHDILVEVHNAPTLQDEDTDSKFWGQLRAPLKKYEKVLPFVMQVAGKVTRNDNRRDYIGCYKGTYQARCVGQTILHELVHYERFRDKTSNSEYGINKRATNLYKQIDQLG